MESNEAVRKPKRVRLSCACVRCRTKKIKCDEKLPSCGPCMAAQVECVVTKPRPDSLVAPIRRKTGLGRDQKGKASVVDVERQGNHHANNTQLPSQSSSVLPPLPSLPPPPRPPPSHHHTVAEATRVFTDPNGTSPAISTPSVSEESPHASGSAPYNADPAHRHARINETGLLHHQDVRRKFVGASSSQALLKWLDAESSGTPLAVHLKGGMTTEEFLFPGLDSATNELPPPDILHSYLDSYFGTTHLMFPIVDEPTIREMAGVAEALDPVHRAMLYAICSMGADSAQTSSDMVLSADGQRLLEAAWKSLASLMSRPFRPSVQALVLIALALRSRNRDGASGMVIGLAIRIAQSLGLHLHQHGNSANLDSRLWHTMYCLDKINGFESGRPSGIRDTDCTVSLAVGASDSTFVINGSRPLNFLGTLTGLCAQISHISFSLFSQGVLSLTTEEALRRIGEADQSLQQWADSVPLELRPGNDAPAANAILPYAITISFLYHYSLITLHRLSLFNHNSLVVPNLGKPLLQPYAGRLQASASICLSSARMILTGLERLGIHPNFRLWTLNAVFTAIIVVSINTWKHPATWQARADLLVLQHASDRAADIFRCMGFPESFVTILSRLYKKTKDKVDQPGQPSRPASRPTSRSNTPEISTATYEPVQGQDTAAVPGQALTADQQLFNNNDPWASQLSIEQLVGQDLDLEALWPFLLGDGVMQTPAVGSMELANEFDFSSML